MKYLNALNLISGVGSKKIELLLNYFEKPQNIWESDLPNLKASGVGEKLAERILEEKGNIHPEAEWEKLQREKIEMLTLTDKSYPQLLREIHRPPYILYKRGKLDLNSGVMIGIVGSRKYSSYGAQATASLSRDLSHAGIVVVSGLAIGVDTIAHRAAIEDQSPTIAVLGSGLDEENIYPRCNLNLAHEIIETGAILSEYPAGSPATNITFPARNRIIAGLTRGTLVTEAGEKSGALITAKYALEYNRDIFAIPGSIFSPTSLGVNSLIKSGAKLVSSARDILEELDFVLEKKESTLPKVPETKEEEIIIKVLSNDPTHIDKLAILTKLETMTVSSTLSMMEIKGWVKNVGGQNYIIT